MKSIWSIKLKATVSSGQHSTQFGAMTKNQRMVTLANWSAMISKNNTGKIPARDLYSMRNLRLSSTISSIRLRSRKTYLFLEPARSKVMGLLDLTNGSTGLKLKQTLKILLKV